MNIIDRSNRVVTMWGECHPRGILSASHWNLATFTYSTQPNPINPWMDPTLSQLCVEVECCNNQGVATSFVFIGKSLQRNTIRNSARRLYMQWETISHNPRRVVRDRWAFWLSDRDVYTKIAPSSEFPLVDVPSWCEVASCLLALQLKTVPTMLSMQHFSVGRGFWRDY